MKRKTLPTIIFLSSIVSLITSGDASFLISTGGIDENITANKGNGRVCSVGSASSVGTTYYSTLEKGIDVANSGSNKVIWVVPEVRYTMTSSKTINKGVTLNIPYDSTNTIDGIIGGSEQIGIEALHEPETYLKTVITLASGVELINNGTINVGGIQGSSNGNFANGQTCGNYSEILCQGIKDNNGRYSTTSAQIKNYGTINNRGSIRGDDENVFGIENFSGSELKANFVVHENYGGSNLADMKNHNNFDASPFKRIDFPNTSVKSKTNYGTTVTGKACMVGSGAQNQTDVNILSNSGAIFVLQPNSYVISSSRITKSTRDLTTGVYTHDSNSNRDLLTLDFYGSCSINPLSMSILNQNVTTSNCYLPISYYNDVSFNPLTASGTATVTANQNLKMLPGSRLAIGNGVTFTISKLFAYDKFDNDPYLNSPYPKNLSEPYLMIDGTLNVSTFGAFADTSNIGAHLNISTDYIATATEMAAGGDQKGGSLTGSIGTYIDYKMPATGYVASDSAGSNLSSIRAGLYNKNYISSLKDDKYFWYTSDGSTYNNTQLVLSPSNGISTKNKAQTYNVVARVLNSQNPYHQYTVSNPSWSISDSSIALTPTVNNDNTFACKFQTPANNTSSDVTYTLTFTCDVTVNGVTTSKTINGLYDARNNSCLTEDTLITMADGSKKEVQDVKAGDKVKVFNHETGKIDISIISLSTHIGEDEDLYRVIHLFFEDREVKIVSEHAFFDLDLLKYVYITEDNVDEYIGHRFVSIREDKITEVKLTRYDIREEITKIFNPVSYYHYDLISDDMLSVGGKTQYAMNIFKYDKDLRYDQKAKEEDLAKYGYLTYDDLKDYMSREVYSGCPACYLKVIFGKGKISKEEMEDIFRRNLRTYRKQNQKDD